MPQKQKILKYGLIFLTMLSSFAAWFSVSRAINIPTAGSWSAPILWFSLFFISLSLCLVLIKRLVWVEIITGISFFFSLFFVLASGGIFHHALIIFLCFLIASRGIERIRQDLKLNIKVDLWKTLRTGSAYLMLAIALIIASQYYGETKNISLQKTLPEFKLNAFSEKLTSKILASINPDFKNLEEESISVDQFVLKASREQFANNQNLAGIDQVLFGDNQALVLAEGRQQLSNLSGMKLNGQEKLADIFSSIVNDKVKDFIAPSFSEDSQLPLLHLILAGALFLTVLSLGSFLGIFLLPLTKLIFAGLRKIGLVDVIKIQKEVEEIV
jgi:hypothetical protein